MQCQDIMRRPVHFASFGETVDGAARKMRDFHIGFLAVCDEHGRVEGVLTDRDLALRVCGEKLSATETVVESVMSRELVACHAHDDLTVAERLMSQHQKSRILVWSDDHQPLGVISLSDIAARQAPLAAQTLRNVAQREVLGGAGARTGKGGH